MRFDIDEHKASLFTALLGGRVTDVVLTTDDRLMHMTMTYDNYLGA